MNSILKFTLMNPRTVLVALAVSFAVALGSTGLAFWNSHTADTWKARAVAAEATVAAQTSAAQAIAEAGNLRAETAERAAAIAVEAGKADRRAAQVYLNLPTPALADQCDAAQALADAAVLENRS